MFWDRLPKLLSAPDASRLFLEKTLSRAGKSLQLIGVLILLPSALPAMAAEDEPELALPVACEIGRNCFVQNFFDHDPSPDRRDYACGRLSYDGHSGTDFRVADIPAMTRGVTVVAAAPGIVKAARDGMPDFKVTETCRQALKGREAGNGVVIDHGEGWETQYSHLRQGSIAVRPGQAVMVGTALGSIGMSGVAEFPHVDFSVRRNGETIDPFTGTSAPIACGETGQALWRQDVLEILKYQPTGGLVSGFAAGPPQADRARNGAYAEETLGDPPALVFWADIFGVQAGDEQRVSIATPDGAILHQSSEILQSSNVSWFAFTGRRRPPDGWQPGTYRGIYSLLRSGSEVARLEDSVQIR
jgi:hypothetical protein